MAATEEQTYFLNQLYRDFLLPTILGSDTRDILYWAGKKIARQYQLDSVEDLPEFFQIASFGELTLETAKSTKMKFELTGAVVADRLAAKSLEFSLEGGVIAEAVSIGTGHTAETQISVDTKHNVVTFEVVIDTHEE